MKTWSGEKIKSLNSGEIFVFGSNPKGIHGAGAAKQALEFGAEILCGRGLRGRTYALVTKNLHPGFVEPSTGKAYAKAGPGSVTIGEIEENIRELYGCAQARPELDFLVSYKMERDAQGRPKKSLNGYSGAEMMEAFARAGKIPANMAFHESCAEHVMDYRAKWLYAQCSGWPVEHFYHLGSSFSQWTPSKFEISGVRFCCAEQAMMYAKAQMFKDAECSAKIMDPGSWELTEEQRKIWEGFSSGALARADILSSRQASADWSACCKKIKALGRQVRGFSQQAWDARKKGVVYGISRRKFAQCNDLRAELMATEGKLLAEASPSDRIWGIGMAAGAPGSMDPSRWEGENLLGYALTKLRIDWEVRGPEADAGRSPALMRQEA